MLCVLKWVAGQFEKLGKSNVLGSATGKGRGKTGERFLCVIQRLLL